MTAFEKLVKGEELTDEEKGTLTEDERKQAAKLELEKIEALRAERRRLETRTGEETDVAKRLRSENLERAEANIFSKLEGLTEERKAEIRQQFQKIDSGAITAEKIEKDLLRAVAASDPDNYFDALKAKKDMERQAAEMLAEAAGQGGTSDGSGESGKQYSQAARELAAQAKKEGTPLTLDEAERVSTQGMRRTYK